MKTVSIGWSDYWLAKAEQHYNNKNEKLSWVVLFLNLKELV